MYYIGLTNDKLVVSLANVQSIRRKDSILYDYLHSVKCDISVFYRNLAKG